MPLASFFSETTMLLGGSFNPLHVGHLRMVFEVERALHPKEVVFIPCASPPHKRAEGLLPFALRHAMLEKAVAGQPRWQVSTIEAERQGPSYTFDTLLALWEKTQKRPGFIFGSGELRLLPIWKRWQELLTLTDFIVLPRGGTQAMFEADVRSLWPEAAPATPPPGVVCAFAAGGGHLYFVEQPELAISASLVREYWKARNPLDYLVPACVQTMLEQEEEAAVRAWGERVGKH